ncbi:hypothetical protein M436DRAFT_64914 [Aureobasidium namibiae CBS 147.97]|uniref:Uncharacterized protein n=1 Tax=Aureobasidium namibiae CBS 147.97 TaxID=1043004 RepID=A0A074XC06_9PEZI
MGRTEDNRRSDRLQRDDYEQEDWNAISKTTNDEDRNKVGKKAAKPHMPCHSSKHTTSSGIDTSIPGDIGMGQTDREYSKDILANRRKISLRLGSRKRVRILQDLSSDLGIIEVHAI